MSHQTLLFDLDGTLCDPLLGFTRSINMALQSHGFDRRSDEELAQYIGPPLDGTLRSLTGLSEPQLIVSLVEQYREYYLRAGFKEAHVYPGVADALTELQRAGMRLAVCTSKPETSARLVLQHFGLLSHFEFVSGGDVGVSKWMQIEQLLEQGVIDNSTLMVGDRAVDLQAGHRNSTRSAGVLWGYGSRAELQAESPLHLFERPSDWLVLKH